MTGMSWHNLQLKFGRPSSGVRDYPNTVGVGSNDGSDPSKAVYLQFQLSLDQERSS